MSLLPPDHLMTDEDLLEHVEDTYARTAAYVKIYEGRRDLSLANGVSAQHIAEHEEDLRVYRRAQAQQWRTIELLQYVLVGDQRDMPPHGASDTSPALVEPEVLTNFADGQESGQDIAGLFGLGDL